MEAMSASISRLCQMVHDTGLWPGTEERLQVVLLEDGVIWITTSTTPSTPFS